MRHTIIVGGGAAGMAAAIAAARAGDRVTVLERMRRELRKLGVTGNGRGNLLNAGTPRYYGDEAFALQVLKAMPCEALQQFFRSVGVPLVTEDEGRMYPAALLAGTAVDALRLCAGQLGVQVLADRRVTALRKTQHGFDVEGMLARYAPDTVLKSGRKKQGERLGEEPFALTCDRVIVAAGGAASPMHGTDGTAYHLLQALGHELNEPRPALCALLTDETPIDGLAGQRVRARLKLCDAAGCELACTQGEALFAQDGVSGIAAMQLARFVQAGCRLQMDLRPGVMGQDEAQDAAAWLKQRAARLGTRTAELLLCGACAPPLAGALLRAAGVPRHTGADALTDGMLQALARQICGFEVRVKGTRGFENAQVTAGGIRTAQFDPATMQSRLCSGLYAAGEVLDVDGDCGGYNLMFAFASGLLAGGHRE